MFPKSKYLLFLTIHNLRDGGTGPADCYLAELNSQLKKLITSKPGERSPHMEDEAEDPKSQPIVWVSKWVDYSDKYGFGYSLNDDSIGNIFISYMGCILRVYVRLQEKSKKCNPYFCIHSL